MAASSCDTMQEPNEDTHCWSGVGAISGPLQSHQKATINFLVAEYLTAQGYKMAAITFAEEDDNQVN